MARDAKQAGQRRTDVMQSTAWWAGLAGRRLATAIWIVLLVLVFVVEFFGGLVRGLIAEWKTQQRMRKAQKARAAEAERLRTLASRKLLSPPSEASTLDATFRSSASQNLE